MVECCKQNSAGHHPYRSLKGSSESKVDCGGMGDKNSEGSNNLTATELEAIPPFCQRIWISFVLVLRIWTESKLKSNIFGRADFKVAAYLIYGMVIMSALKAYNEKESKGGWEKYKIYS